ncbi:hypothetical protein BDB00DRAFT_821726 [Zychaea mexicana]|uniref:uncharacterized protein n=1 Tax=Zychaea mexicana TaxID=64656 RepID=UPI0022FF1D64|nr:uncharacterized protein BDB00DRAFT_821726 [Zychaea mexicana]KAI9493821.1 hypothetical protein BDB00DRAFT_821726 [Zychaea mexicana]
MLSASTLASNASDAFSTNSGATTPLSPYSTDSTPKNSGNNPLAELIETEKSYMETLKIIDIQLAPLWTDQSITDFTELLANVREIIKVNKRFCAKLVKIAANPQTIKELGDVLMQWVDDMEVPYANFSRGYILNLNQRQDIAKNPGIQKLLKDLSAQASYEISLESLFNAPAQQLNYYKVLYSRLLESAEPGRADHKLLVKANRRIDTVMLMAQKSSGKSSGATDPSSSPSSSASRAHTKPLPIVTPIQTNMTSVRSELIMSFDGCKLDCSQVVDLFSGSPMHQYQPRLPDDAAVVLRDHFVQLPGETNETTPIRVQLILTNDVLLVAKEGTNNVYTLLYPPLTVNDITVKSKNLDRELVGEYIVEFAVVGKKHLTMRADLKETRNKWVGVNDNAPSSMTLAPKALRAVVQKHVGGGDGAAEGSSSLASASTPADKNARKSGIRKHDIFSFYTDQTGEISPLSSDESSSEEFLPKVPALPPKDIVQQEQQKHETKNLPAPPPPPKASNDESDLKPPAPAPAPAPARQDSHLSPRSASPAPSAVSTSTFNSSGAEDSPGAAARPVSPRTIEISHAVAPVAAMQAVTQEYNAADPKLLPRTSSVNRGVTSSAAVAAPAADPYTPAMTMPARTSSSRQQPQQPPMQKALPQRPPAAPAHHQQHHQQQQQPGPMHHHPSMNRSLPPQPQSTQQPRPPVIHQPQPQYMARPGAPPLTQRRSFHNNMPGNRSPSPGMAVGGPGGYPQQQPTPPPQQQQQQQQQQQPPMGRHLNTPPYLHQQRSMDDLNSPPRSPTPHMVNGQPNGIRQVVYSGQCEVFHWKAESWYAVDGQCLLEVRQTFTNRSCVAVLMQNTGQLYLNAWVLPNTVICHASPTDVSISVFMGNQKENYLVHFQSPQEAAHLFQILQRTHQEAIRMGGTMGEGTLRGAPPGVIAAAADFLDDDPKDDEPKEEPQQPQTLRLVMQCKAKLFVQQEHSSWSSFGSVTMKISQQLPSKKMHIEMENGKGNKATKLVSATVHSRNVSRMNPKRITFLLTNEKERQSMVYMVQIKEEETGQKIYEYIKTKNAENGW